MSTPASGNGSGPDAGADLLHRLVGEGLEAPDHDPSLPDEMRDFLERTVAPWLERLPAGVTLRVSKNRLRAVLRCEAHLLATMAEGSTAPTAPLVAGAMLDRLFAQVVVGFPVGADPVGDALAAADAAGDPSLFEAWVSLQPEEQAEVRAMVTPAAAALAARWPPLPADDFTRLQENLRVELGGGRVVLSGRVDLVLGPTGGPDPGSVLIDVKSGQQGYDDPADADWYAALETLRHGVPPLQAGNYYLRTGRLVVETVDDDRLGAATRRISEGLTRLVHLAAGEPATVTPNDLCRWCPAFDDCPPGQGHVAETDPGFDPGCGPDDPDDAEDDGAHA